jgi:hypothetical protein
VLLAEIAIAWVDTRPTWDDTGVTAGVLLMVSAVGGLSRLRPWLAAAIAVSPLLVAELRGSDLELLFAPVMALVGAYGGPRLRSPMARPSN